MTWSQPAFEEVARLVSHRTGLAFAPTRYESVEMGIRRAMTRAGFKDPGPYRERLAADAATLDELLVELTVGETYFFREPGQFQFIRREVLPDLRRRGPGHVLRAWSAGCASGEEAYSLAILFAEEGLAEHIHLLATDISRAALARARRAVYGDWSLRGEGALAVQPYLIRGGGKEYRLDETIRRHVAFEYLNLALDVYPSLATGTWGMDLILCRNVLIYFDQETVQRVAQRFYESLAEGGWLITASSDPPLSDKAPFEAVLAEEGVFYRHSGSGDPWSAARTTTGGAPAQSSWFMAAETSKPGWENPLPGFEDAVPAIPETSAAAPLPLSEERPSHASSRSEDGPATTDHLAEARAAFARGEYARVVQLTRDREGDAGAAALQVRALANLETADAERACAAATARHPLSAELYYLHGVLLLDLERDEEAVRAVRRVLYLDRTLAMAHFTLGSLLRRLGDLRGARRAYRNARDLCTSGPPEQLVPLADGERAGRLAAVAEVQLKLLEAQSR